MATIGKLLSIGIIVISIGIGLLSFYVFSDLPKEQKKKQLEEVTSQLINFVIFIWLAKIILNAAIFIRDPLAILAYPSNSHAFYLAILFSSIVIAYKSKRHIINVVEFIESFLHVFLVASFLYEFIQLVWNNNIYSFGYLVLLTLLIVSYVLIRGRLSTTMVIIIMLVGWSMGMMLLSFIQPFATVFGYIMAPWFVSLFFIVCLSLLIYKQRKRGS